MYFWKVIKGLLYSFILVAPVAAMVHYAYKFSNNCAAQNIATFPCRILVPSAYVIGGIAALLGFFLGFCLGFRLFGRTKLATYYFLFLVAVPAAYGTYIILPVSIQQEYFERQNEQYCHSLSGIEGDKCLLTLYRNRTRATVAQYSWCDNILNTAVKNRCLTDLKASRGDESGCTKLTGDLPFNSYPKTLAPETVAMLEREHCYRTATFGAHNILINQNIADYRFGFNVDICNDEPRVITQNYCLFRLGRCDLMKNGVMAKDCLLYKKLYLK